MAKKSQEEIRPQCQIEFQRSKEADECILAKLDKLNGRFDSLEAVIYKDNGGECMQSRVNRHDRLLKALVGVLATIGGTILTILGFAIKDKWL